jgi:hypothetical protein
MTTRRRTTAPMPDPEPDLYPHSRADVRPVPDPTSLTTRQLHRELASVKEVIYTRLDGMDRAIVLFNESVTRVPTDTDKQIVHLRELHDEKFQSIAVQFLERDTRTEQTSRDSKVAVDAALQAAKEAVGEQNKSSALAIAKSEGATTKQIDQILALLQAATKASDDKFGDLKDRLNLIEGREMGARNTEKKAGDHWGLIFGGVMALVAVASLIMLALQIMPHK